MVSSTRRRDRLPPRTHVGTVARSLGANTITLYLFPFPRGAGRDSTILDV